MQGLAPILPGSTVMRGFKPLMDTPYRPARPINKLGSANGNRTRLRPDLLGPPEANWRVFRLLDLLEYPVYRHEPVASSLGRHSVPFSDRAPGSRLAGAVLARFLAHRARWLRLSRAPGPWVRSWC